ncbi:MAG: S-layer homology domain-containing protein, partial [Clostridia bacterium]|nr:S-layer homology domain-containing protein [Clostridia bacterium]
AKNAGLVNGKGNNMFEPRATATRAEAAAIIMRFCFLQMNG